MATEDGRESSALLQAVRPPRMSTRHLGRTVLFRILATVLVLAVIAALIGVAVVRRSFPQTTGELTLDGLTEQVSVNRDASGIPYIEASNAQDLFMAQGFVHAQERFWEMDFRRHVTAGRLAEMFGPSQFSTDSFIRTLGWRKVAEKEVAALDDTSLGYYEAYAAGVNAYLKDKSPTQVSLEYGILGLQQDLAPIEPWTPVDSVSWLKAMAWDLRSNIEDEIDRAILSTELDDDQMADVFPPYPYDQRPTIIDGTGDKARTPDAEANAGGTLTPPSRSSPTEENTGSMSTSELPNDLVYLKATLRSLPALLGVNSPDIGSNSWVVSGKHTKTGAPLLANDPHLSPAMPSVWQQIGLKCSTVTKDCPFDVSGFSFSGLPGVVIGHNQQISWGLTNLGPDVADLVVEKISDADVVYEDSREPVVVRKESIKIAGEEPRTITVRSTKHGPIISGLGGSYRSVLDASTGATEKTPAPNKNHYQLALEWTALEPGNTPAAIFAINSATNWNDFRAAASLFDVPAQNLIYADVEGNIGYQAPGKIPRRGSGDGMLPRQGWVKAQDWQGYLKFEELPSEYNPERGWIVTANNPVAKPGDAVQLSNDFDYGDRAERITELMTGLVERGDVTAQDLSDIQGDNANPLAESLLPELLALDPGQDEKVTKAQKLLSEWNGHDDADSAAAAYFNVLAKTMLDEVFAPKLPAGAPPSGGSRWYLVVENLLQDPDSPWWKDASASNRDEALTRAMASAWDTSSDLMGPEPVTWRWGTLHALTIKNASLGESGITAIEKLFNRGPYEVSGGSGVVNATGWDASAGYETNWVPSMRQIVDLGNFDSSQWINLTGTSGHAFHPNYADQTDDWAANINRPWPFSPQAIDSASKDVLLLNP